MNIKLIIFISLLIIYLLIGDRILEYFAVTPMCADIANVPTLPTIKIDKNQEFSIDNIISRNASVNSFKQQNLNDVNKKYGCIENNYFSKIRNL